MKKILNSMRIFTAQYTVTTMLQVLGIFMVGYVAITLIAVIFGGLEAISDDSFFAGFLSGFIPGFTVIIPAAGAFLLAGIYNCNMPITPGYKYFHGIHDSENHFRRALIGANIISLFMGALGTLINYIASFFVEDMYSPMLSVGVCLLATGIMNFSGHCKNTTLRFILMMPIFMGVGFFVGFSSAAEEDGDKIPMEILYIAVAIVAVIYIAGLIFTLTKCKKYWRADK